MGKTFPYSAWPKSESNDALTVQFNLPIFMKMDI